MKIALVSKKEVADSLSDKSDRRVALQTPDSAARQPSLWPAQNLPSDRALVLTIVDGFRDDCSDSWAVCRARIATGALGAGRFESLFFRLVT
ncbi:hypothetical protein [Variovorax saccharolyticus]|uniref:hypothetical protein n=1 Tax=Variovorax saccharolyticus TaxID=3053516 RepID=UPI002577B397|nr:hypothetical protein [Variovorax sp. J31P216]MDM0030082.1 hypothetical protein [Variovorax sp. J31P216]